MINFFIVLKNLLKRFFNVLFILRGAGICFYTPSFCPSLLEFIFVKWGQEHFLIFNSCPHSEVLSGSTKGAGRYSFLPVPTDYFISAVLNAAMLRIRYI